MPAVASNLKLLLALLQDRQPACLLLVRDAVRILQRRCVWARRVLEAKDAVVSDFLQQRDGLLEVAIVLAGEANNDVRSNADLAPRRFHPGNAFQVLLARVLAHHQRKQAR